jgi:uncharacterized Zn finger protein
MARTIARPPATTDEQQASTGLAPLSDDIIARQTDAGSFSRGKTYFRGKRIFNAVRRGDLLRARCRGSSGGPYLVEATLAPAGKPKSRNPVKYLCNCPRGGFCKHVVALLLTWIEKPESFDVRPPIADLLTSKSREDLIALIEAMLAADPNLEPLIELPPPTAIAPDASPVDEAVIRRLIGNAFADPENEEYGGGYGGYGNYDYGYDDFSFATNELERVVGYADAYIEGGHWRNAMLVSAVLVEQLPSELAVYQDEEGEFADLLRRTDANLAASLEAQVRLPAEERLTDEERGRLIEAVLAIWEADLDAGGLDYSDGGPETIGALATPAEQERVRARLREMILPAVGDSWKHQWHNRAVIGFLSLLKGEAGLSDDELLAEYRNAELWDDTTALLLEMGRVEEAIGLASRKLTMAPALMAFADRLLGSGDPERIKQAIALIDDRLWEREGQNVHDDQLLREWLEKRYLEHGSPEKALELAKSRFKVSPCKATYDAVKTAARHPGQPGELWPLLRPTLIATLGKSNGLYALIDIHLEEGEVAEALKSLAKLEKPGQNAQPAWGFTYLPPAGSYSARVAAAAEADFPDEAVRIYQKLAERQIAQRGRPAYQTAATYLVRVMRLLEGDGRAAEWQSFIADLRQRNKSLRALREELDALGLG